MSLDDDYANAAYIPDAQGFLEYWEGASHNYRETENSLGRAQLNQPYGDHPDQAFDLFYPACRPLGLVVIVHGGYWLRFGRRDFSHLARGATLRDWAVAIPSYPLAPGARIPEITQSIVVAVKAAASQIGGPIVLTGHSAGGHLVARMGQNDVGLPSVVRNRIKTILPISPVADLLPLLQTEMNMSLNLTTSIAKAESPANYPKPDGIDAHIWVGAAERPVFLAQAKLLADNWQAALTVEASKHHFDIIAGLESPSSALMAALLGD